MARRKQKKEADVATPLKAWNYVGPPYRNVKLEGVPVFAPATITQARIGVLVDRYPEKLSRYFARTSRVKPGIEVVAEEQQADDDPEPLPEE